MMMMKRKHPQRRKQFENFIIINAQIYRNHFIWGPFMSDPCSWSNFCINSEWHTQRETEHMLSNGDAKPTQNWCEMGIVKFLIGRLSFVVKHVRRIYWKDAPNSLQNVNVSFIISKPYWERKDNDVRCLPVCFKLKLHKNHLIHTIFQGKFSSKRKCINICEMQPTASAPHAPTLYA